MLADDRCHSGINLVPKNLVCISNPHPAFMNSLYVSQPRADIKRGTGHPAGEITVLFQELGHCRCQIVNNSIVLRDEDENKGILRKLIHPISPAILLRRLCGGGKSTTWTKATTRDIKQNVRQLAQPSNLYGNNLTIASPS